MSRCFPFPLPGYEARPRSEQQHKDLLKRRSTERKKTGGKERKEKDRDHRKDKHNKKHKREKHGERRKNEDRDKDKKQSLGQETQKNYKHGNRKPEERGQNEAVKDIKPTDELKERNSLGRMVNKSVEATQDKHGKVQNSSDSMVRANKKGMGRGVDSKAKTKNGKSLQVGSAEMHSRRKHGCNGVDVRQDYSNAQSSEDVHTANPVVSDSRREANGRITPSPNTLQKAEEMQPDPEISVHSAKGENDRISTKDGMMGKENQSANNCRGKMNQQFKRKIQYKNKEKEMEKNGTVNEHKHENLGARKNKVHNLMDLGFHNEKKFTSDNINKRKDLSTNSSPHELLGTNACEIGRDKPQDVYNNGTTGSHCSAEDIASVSSSGYMSNKGYLKQPHPDTKYLSQLYSLPPAQDFSYYIDQDWLFSQDRDERKTAAFEAAESDQVWSDAQLIDTADVIALP
uniref:Uncharacterized protein n=1 Tax=Setaria italica TaxID=4555 RepID=K3YNG8_SETIT